MDEAKPIEIQKEASGESLCCGTTDSPEQITGSTKAVSCCAPSASESTASELPVVSNDGSCCGTDAEKPNPTEIQTVSSGES